MNPDISNVVLWLSAATDEQHQSPEQLAGMENLVRMLARKVYAQRGTIVHGMHPVISKWLVDELESLIERVDDRWVSMGSDPCDTVKVIHMAMPQRPEMKEEIKRLDVLLEYAVMLRYEAAAARRCARPHRIHGIIHSHRRPQVEHRRNFCAEIGQTED